ncbi:MAG: archease [Candidatus Anammoxibacter sp.]
MGKDYELIDHTADLGILVFGNDLNHLFANAANALSDILTDKPKVEDVKTKEIIVTGIDLEQLMINWLQEVLYYYDVYSFLFKRFDVHEIITSKHEEEASSPTSLTIKATGFGEIFDHKRHSILTEVKAATYHQIEVKENNGKWQARIIFDL